MAKAREKKDYVVVDDFNGRVYYSGNRGVIAYWTKNHVDALKMTSGHARKFAHDFNNPFIKAVQLSPLPTLAEGLVKAFARGTSRWRR